MNNIKFIFMRWDILDHIIQMFSLFNSVNERSVAEILTLVLEYPAFGQISYKELYNLRIVEALPDDHLVNPNEIAPTIIMSDLRFNDFFTNIFSDKWRWDAYCKQIPEDLLVICHIGVKYHKVPNGLSNLIILLENKITIEHLRKMKKYKDPLTSFVKIVKLFGIVPPQGCDIQEKAKYVVNGFNMDINKQFSNDDRIILKRAEQIGFNFEYSTRSDLRLNFARFVFNDAAGMFVVLQPLYQFSRNKALYITMEELKDVKDDVLIGFGKLTSYNTYSVDELVHCIDVVELKIVYPDDPTSKMHRRILMNIIVLLTNTGYFDDALKLVDKLKKYIAAKEELSTRLRKYTNEFNEMSNSNKTTIIAIMTNMLMTGMYMRKWRSNATPYPISEADTLVNLDPEKNVSIAILKITNLLVGSKIEVFVNSLPSFYLDHDRNNKITPTKMSVGEIIAKVMSGDACIRIFSSLFITTSQVYTKLFAEIDLLPNIAELDYIN